MKKNHSSSIMSLISSRQYNPITRIIKNTKPPTPMTLNVSSSTDNVFAVALDGELELEAEAEDELSELLAEEPMAFTEEDNSETPESPELELELELVLELLLGF